ncbi:MAG: hypothetical protein NT094_03825 [Candidatus Staskawiczbacteria bacterium]|nr:hypothetical protein [Candidatus Staskawiczbacteria bacterium]
MDEYKLGWGDFYGQWWITIPIRDMYGAFRYFKLRQDPNAGTDKMTFPGSTKTNPIEAQIYGWGTLQSEEENVLICEGEHGSENLKTSKKYIFAMTMIKPEEKEQERWQKR